jgi:hypothetical protein
VRAHELRAAIPEIVSISCCSEDEEGTEIETIFQWQTEGAFEDVDEDDL